jgi:hypothetical protein
MSKARKKSSFALHEATFSFIVSRSKKKMSIIKGNKKTKKRAQRGWICLNKHKFASNRDDISDKVEEKKKIPRMCVCWVVVGRREEVRTCDIIDRSITSLCRHDQRKHSLPPKKYKCSAISGDIFVTES